MGEIMLAFYRSFVVQFKRKQQKTKMTNNQNLLDGSERSMIPILKYGLGLVNRDTKKSVIQLEEFSAGTGISDLTVFTLDKRILAKRKNDIRKPITSRNQIKVLTALMAHNGATIQQLSTETTLTKPTLSKILESLESSNVVTKEGTSYIPNAMLRNASTENIIAIEAKVKDWKSGVRQAMRYKEYADFSYLAIYESHIKGCLSNITIFEQLGIGLIGVSDEGVILHLEAKKSEVTNPESRLLAFERMISIVDVRHESYVARNGFVS